jgi:hypothetical protein
LSQVFDFESLAKEPFMSLRADSFHPPNLLRPNKVQEISLYQVCVGAYSKESQRTQLVKLFDLFKTHFCADHNTARQQQETFPDFSPANGADAPSNPVQMEEALINSVETEDEQLFIIAQIAVSYMGSVLTDGYLATPKVIMTGNKRNAQTAARFAAAISDEHPFNLQSIYEMRVMNPLAFAEANSTKFGYNGVQGISMGCQQSKFGLFDVLRKIFFFLPKWKDTPLGAFLERQSAFEFQPNQRTHGIFLAEVFLALVCHSSLSISGVAAIALPTLENAKIGRFNRPQLHCLDQIVQYMPIQVERCNQRLPGSLRFANGCNIMPIEDIPFDFNVKDMTKCNIRNLLLQKHHHFVEAEIIVHDSNINMEFRAPAPIANDGPNLEASNSLQLSPEMDDLEIDDLLAPASISALIEPQHKLYVEQTPTGNRTGRSRRRSRSNSSNNNNNNAPIPLPQPIIKRTFDDVPMMDIVIELEKFNIDEYRP